MKTRKSLAFVGFLAASALVMTACGGSGDSSGGSKTDAAGGPAVGGDLVIARATDALTMDSTSAEFNNNGIFPFLQMGQALFQVTEDGQKVEPLLAESSEVSSDQLTVTIKLRTDVKFSDGTPMTAKDVKFSIDADTATAKTGWGYINNAIKEVKVVDDATIAISLKYAWAPLLADLSLFSNVIVPENYQGKTKEAFYEAPVLTGPFKWGEWKKGQSLKLVKNENYWEKGKPYLDSVTWNVIPDANTRKLQIQGGQADIDEYPDWSSFASLKSTPGVKAYSFPSTQMDYLSMNQQHKPFQDVHVRRAIAYATDRKALVDAVLFGNGTVANSLLSPGTPFYDKDAQGIQFDLAKAKEELAQSSTPNGFKTTLLVPSGNANRGAIAQIMQDQLKPLGIDVEIKQLDPTSVSSTRMAGDYDMNLSAWTMDIPDPDQWTSFALDPNGGNKSAFTMYDNKTILDLNNQAQRETDQAKRADLYKQIQKIAGEDSPLVYLFYSPYAYASTDKVDGFQVNPLGYYKMMNVSKKK